ncbi:MAG: SDR family NAD(P)-dependent oxidoreductase [Gammaproteobacteria bacterium]|nr:SDR family NAD(P)-dependent oxidoreductase [Gammaproteobacteria bacterium]MCW5582308.1 SDR family NAD(P)-dependent oxidoreductase [Gammaproteobacteria bacterium]
MNSKSILITGCSSGIGLCSAHALKQKGYRVFATARKEEDVKKLQSQGFESILLDVNHSASIKHAIKQIVELTDGTLDALFNNAGYMQTGAIEDITRDIERAQFETNVFGPMELIRLVLPIMRKQGYGRIIQNSSILGIITLPFYGAYNASKFALEGFSNTLRQELWGTNIHVSIINPGPIKTHLRETAFQIYQKTIDHQKSHLFTKEYKKMEQIYFASEEKTKLAQKPDAVVKKLIHALESSRPRAHYYVGYPAILLAFLRRILPDCALDWMLRKAR